MQEDYSYLLNLNEGTTAFVVLSTRPPHQAAEQTLHLPSQETAVSYIRTESYLFRDAFLGRAVKERKAEASEESAGVEDPSMAPTASPGASAAERVFKEASEKRTVVVYTERDAELQKA